MKARVINQAVLEQTNFDSGSPRGLSAVVHQFKEPGNYVVSFLRNDAVLEEVGLAVSGRLTTREEMTAAAPAPLTLDLAAVRRGSDSGPGTQAALGSGGYVTFTLPAERADATIRVRRRDAQGNASDAFDSNRLGADDVFAVTLLRPGRYALRNTLTGAEGTITVSYPVIGKEPYRPPAPVNVNCTAEGFSPAQIELQPAQGLIFRFAVPSRIQIELAEADDGPAGEARPQKRHWQKQPAPRRR